MKDTISKLFSLWLEERAENFCGILSATDINGVVHQEAHGLANKATNTANTPETAFALASGTKLFTGLAVCKLIESGKLSLQDKIWDVLSKDLGKISKDVTIFHLLTHTSGVGDYIDEDADDIDEMMEALYKKYPANEWVNMDYYLQMSIPLPPKFAPGEEYAYSNSGFVLLGLAVEAVSGMPFQQYVTDEIIKPIGLICTGFYRLDALPPNFAIGYIGDNETNIDCMPIIGGSDGGIFSCAADMDTLWRAIFDHKILSKETTALFLKPHVLIDEDEEDGTIENYGLGVYIFQDGDNTFYGAIGGDNGVGFLSGYYPKTKIVVSCFCNTGYQSGSLLWRTADVL